MIGGYVGRERDPALEARLAGRLDPGWSRIRLPDRGFLFHDEPFGPGSTARLVGPGLVVLTQDALIAPRGDGGYRDLAPGADFVEAFSAEPAAALDALSGDFRMIVVRTTPGAESLTLVSNRAGSGRIYHHATARGVAFCSDLRVLLRLVGCDPSPLAIYALLKYGAVPEPLTVSTTARAVPVGHYLRHDLVTGAERHVPYFRLAFPCDDGASAAAEGDALLRPVEQALRRTAELLAGRKPAMLISGGIDSSLYGCYLAEAHDGPLPAFCCAFGEDDPELGFARRIAARIGCDLHVERMDRDDALGALEAAARGTDHPFADFSSLPIAFLLGRVRERLGPGRTVVECNGGDDCFGFPDLAGERKYAIKHRVPRWIKWIGATALRRLPYWKWESHGGPLARVSALVDVHERSAVDYFYVMAPVGHLRLGRTRGWDEALDAVLDHVFAGCTEPRAEPSWGASATVRQLLQVNSRRWAAKALSTGEDLGLRVVYPYLWREVLRVQGTLPWSAKVRDGVVKWPLKRLLEAYMPAPFIHRPKSGFVPPFGRWLAEPELNRRAREVLLDHAAVVARVAPPDVLESLLDDARDGRRLRHSVLNFLWAALFTETWLAEHGRVRPGATAA